jgi:hypothetical protein
VGDEADAAGLAKEPPALETQFPETIPPLPPPSNTALDEDTPPAADTPIPKEPVIELPKPADAPTDEAPTPKDACGNAPPMLRHVLIPGVMGDVPDVVGLTPGAVNTCAPNGILVGGTPIPGPIPSGEVSPSGGVTAAPLPI